MNDLLTDLHSHSISLHVNKLSVKGWMMSFAATEQKALLELSNQPN
jgi:hypothetical protein